MKFAITITARMKSERLPLKVIRYIEGKPMIEHMIDRLKLSKLADEIIMCTSTDPQDDILIDVAEKKGIKCFRGDEIDVLKRLLDAAKKFNADFIVNATADNPLTDHHYIDKIIQTFKETNADHVTCTNLPIGAFSHGLKVEILEKVVNEKEEEDTEIWGRFFEDNNSVKNINLEVEDELNHPEVRLTVDEKNDLELMRRIFRKFYPINKNFELKDVVKYLLDNPDIMSINQQVVQRLK